MKTIPPSSFSSARRIGLSKKLFSDLYHFLLTTSWPMLLLIIFTLYISCNVFFAGLYMMGGHCVENMNPHSFFEAFFFSVQTMATIGYGKMVPKTHYANLLVTIEALIGLIGLAMATGLMFAKFSKPTARVLFSRNAVISNRDGIKSLMIRLANERNNQIVEAEFRLVLAYFETTVEGERIRRFYDLELIRNRSVSFALAWTVIHPIHATSPLAHFTVNELLEKRATLILSVVGLDETYSQMIHTRKTYSMQDILMGQRFADIIQTSPEGIIEINYHKFHETQPALVADI